MRYLHTMLRVRNLDAALKFYRDALGLKEVRRMDNAKGRFTLVFLCAPEDEPLLANSKGRGQPLVELTYNYDEEDYGEARHFGHLAYEGRRHLCHLRTTAGPGNHHQPASARRPDGLRALARQSFHRTVAEGRRPAAEGAVGLDAEYGPLVTISRPKRLQLQKSNAFGTNFAAFYALRLLAGPGKRHYRWPRRSRSDPILVVSTLRSFGKSSFGLC
jgi:catechol 2,3-dioxygenase-like lactoylglutathione lyase family enzyme